MLQANAARKQTRGSVQHALNESQRAAIASIPSRGSCENFAARCPLHFNLAELTVTQIDETLQGYLGFPILGPSENKRRKINAVNYYV